jgi:tetratricopeptide (TPR) repeat protein
MSPPFDPNASRGRSELSDTLRRGLDLCRVGEWDRGLAILGYLAQSADRSALPGLFYSYLGYGIARCEGRVEEGVKLCQHSIKIEFYQPENYHNLARAHLLDKDRRAAVRAIDKGLKIDPHNLELLTLTREIGVRREPVLSFLSRDNILNRFLGRLRHRITGR